MNDLPTVDDMTKALAAHKNRDGYTGKIYKQQSDAHKGAELSAAMLEQVQALKATTQRGPINWNDLEQVKARTYDYMQACANARVYPSVMGLAVQAYGVSRQALNGFLTKYPDTPSARFIMMVKDTFADVLSNAALFHNADPVSVIFQLKNHFGHTDKVQVEPVPLQAETDPVNVEDIRRRYMIEE